MAKQEITSVISGACIEDSPEVLESYARDISFVNPLRPRWVIKPGNTSEVQSLVKWARENSITLIPVSSGPPHFKGDTVPCAGGAIIIDLSKMKNIVRVDRRNRVALIEPGVTFGELIPRLAQNDLRLNLPLLPRPNKSVIGSMLEREPVIMPIFQWDVYDPLSCIEVIFGTGDMFRTGAAAGPGTLEEQWAAGQAQVNPMGPGQVDIGRIIQGAQGTMGIVTWATVRCEAMPKIQAPYIIGADDLEKLIDYAYKLLWLKAPEELLILNKSTLAAVLARDGSEYEPIKNSLPRWSLFFSLSAYEYFPEERIAFQTNQIKDAAQKAGIMLTNSLPSASAHDLLDIFTKPSKEPYWKTMHKGSCQDIFFLTTLDRTQKYIDMMYQTAEKFNYAPSDIGVYIQPMVQGIQCHCEFNLFYNPENKSEVDRVKDLYMQAIEDLMNAGAFFSRPYGAQADMVYRRDGETAAVLKKIKSIFDPENIMNSGKLCF